MESLPWRVVVVRAWLHDGKAVVVLLVGAEPGSPVPGRRIATGSAEEACAVLAAVLGELTADPTDPDMTD
ncbi:hypothetical protein G5C60_12465 [Streptomyces sp. HC44]|uniref:Uncharacterized protein n=1 Tax=Streptomyces scabichelini TaxID=2711217 RepID=A0A6G4V366_9ACTN|nr:hypothetical protein [Streptomyces scabichelini]NGO08411.1 hypothetical protein [Streptomyces scabichelini]